MMLLEPTWGSNEMLREKERFAKNKTHVCDLESCLHN